MRVRCLATRLTADQRARLRISTTTSPEYELVPGRSYLVLGITFMLPQEPHGGGVHYQIVNDNGACRSIPSVLFSVDDERGSKYWMARELEGGDLALWPEEFFVDFFHDDLSEGLAAPVAAFERVVQRLDSEFEDTK